jgi:hypothetical protein
MMSYEQSIEIKMQRLFAKLSEKDRRRYAGIEAAKMGHGGIDYISGLFDMDSKTVRRGLTELELIIRLKAYLFQRTAHTSRLSCECYAKAKKETDLDLAPRQDICWATDALSPTSGAPSVH